MIDLGAGVFDNATVDTNILLIQKGNTNNLSNLQALDLSKVKNIKNFYHFKTNWLEVKQLGESAWSILNPTQNQIKQKIENIGKPLKDWDIRIVMGIKSGLKSVFEIDPICYEKFCSANNDIETVVFPILHGKDIGKYSVNTDTLNYLIFAKRGFEMAKYPIIKEYLTKYRDDLAKRATINTHPWYELQQPQMGIYLEFEKERIVYPDIVRQPSFSLCKAGIYQDNTTYSLNTNSKYILSLLNSKLLFYYYKFIANNLGENAVRMFSLYVELLPIPELSDSEEAPFIALVDKILALKSGVLDGCAPFENASPSKTLSTQALEAEIDALVYRLYGLSAAEIAMVEGGN